MGFHLGLVGIRRPNGLDCRRSSSFSLRFAPPAGFSRSSRQLQGLTRLRAPSHQPNSL